MELRPTATPQALVDDSNCDLEKLKLNPDDIADEIIDYYSKSAIL